jgi:hypothetical protein
VVMTRYVQNNTFPMSLEDYQKILQFTVLYGYSILPPFCFWVSACRLRCSSQVFTLHYQFIGFLHFLD